MADRGPDPRQLGGGDRRADPGAADEHAPLCVAGEDGIPDLARLVRVVDPDGVGVHAEVEDVVAVERRENGLAQAYASVVERDRNLHDLTVPERRSPTPNRRLSRVWRAGEGEAVEMNDAELWRELGQQLRVDSVR